MRRRKFVAGFFCLLVVFRDTWQQTTWFWKKTTFDSIYQSNPGINFECWSRLEGLVYELCPSPGGVGWMFQHRRGCEVRPFMLPEQKCLREYFSPCEIVGKVLRFSVGPFQRASNKRRSSSTSRAALKDVPGDRGIRFWADNNQVGSIVPSRKDNHGARVRPWKTACRRNWHWTELTALTWEALTLGTTQTSEPL